MVGDSKDDFDDLRELGWMDIAWRSFGAYQDHMIDAQDAREELEEEKAKEREAGR